VVRNNRKTTGFVFFSRNIKKRIGCDMRMVCHFLPVMSSALVFIHPVGRRVICGHLGPNRYTIHLKWNEILVHP